MVAVLHIDFAQAADVAMTVVNNRRRLFLN